MYKARVFAKVTYNNQQINRHYGDYELTIVPNVGETLYLTSTPTNQRAAVYTTVNSIVFLAYPFGMRPENSPDVTLFVSFT